MDDEYSRVMPGRKDVKSVKKPGERRFRLQKRLLLMNIDELYYLFVSISHYFNCTIRNQCLAQTKTVA
jgi:hypothetical protein